jgi:heat-inducible transcriptional repressor
VSRVSGKSTHEGPLGERAQQLLKVLVERYIRDGQPVGSRTLARDAGGELSPATIRNVMADLEELGLVASPHTSAGRVPTVSGYRLFVDSLMTLRPLAEGEVERARSQIAPDVDGKALADKASRLLSELTHMAGLVMVPHRDHLAYRQIEFLPLSGRRVLAILVTSEGEVHNRVIDTAKSYSPAELEQAANYLNRTYAGKDLEAVRKALVAELGRTRDDMDAIMSRALEIAGQMFEGQSSVRDALLVAGQTNLMDFNELQHMQRLRQLFDAFIEQQQLLHLLDRCMVAEGVQIFIGEESGYHPLDQCSLVTAPYVVEGQVAGVLGVIGPTRMPYDRVVSVVDITARLLGAALKAH